MRKIQDRIETDIEAVVMAIHRRNGGRRKRLNPEMRLLDPALGLDSLDLAEIVVALEKRFGVSPFNVPAPPRTWGDAARLIRELVPGPASRNG